MAAGAGYQPVRPASPSREPTSEPEGPHEDLGEDARRQGDDVDVEQQERLLSDKEGDDDDDDDNVVDDPKDHARRGFCCRPWLVWLSAFVGLLMILLLALFLRVSGHGQGGNGSNGKKFRRPSSDYILDADWDFAAPPQVREYHWTIQDIVANPDGVFRPMLALNGKFPGEMIRCNEGDTIVVNVKNRAANATSIHWHGLYQNGTNWMDGAPGITQCPIASGGSFRYEFNVTGQTGTCKSKRRNPFLLKLKREKILRALLTRSVRFLSRTPCCARFRRASRANSHPREGREGEAEETILRL